MNHPNVAAAKNRKTAHLEGQGRKHGKNCGCGVEGFINHIVCGHGCKVMILMLLALTRRQCLLVLLQPKSPLTTSHILPFPVLFFPCLMNSQPWESQHVLPSLALHSTSEHLFLLSWLCKHNFTNIHFISDSPRQPQSLAPAQYRSISNL